MLVAVMPGTPDLINNEGIYGIYVECFVKSTVS